MNVFVCVWKFPKKTKYSICSHMHLNICRNGRANFTHLMRIRRNTRKDINTIFNMLSTLGSAFHFVPLLYILLYSFVSAVDAVVCCYQKKFSPLFYKFYEFSLILSIHFMLLWAVQCCAVAEHSTHIFSLILADVLLVWFNKIVLYCKIICVRGAFSIAWNFIHSWGSEKSEHTYTKKKNYMPQSEARALTHDQQASKWRRSFSARTTNENSHSALTYRHNVSNLKAIMICCYDITDTYEAPCVCVYAVYALENWTTKIKKKNEMRINMHLCNKRSEKSSTAPGIHIIFNAKRRYKRVHTHSPNFLP